MKTERRVHELIELNPRKLEKDAARHNLRVQEELRTFPPGTMMCSRVIGPYVVEITIPAPCGDPNCPWCSENCN